ncbi:hypothetical protein CR513_61662, partial [Mucuna pruriens]
MGLPKRIEGYPQAFVTKKGKQRSAKNEVERGKRKKNKKKEERKMKGGWQGGIDNEYEHGGEDIFTKDIPCGLPPIRGIEHKIDFIMGAIFPYKANIEESN